ncbi:WD40-repeat-containing domain protein [Cladochytrium replicatum]|nr:WD40-repeat-containing domain protein [Cladochytrium replicatum]
MAQVQVRFISRQPGVIAPETPILVPIELKRYGLSEIVNHLLGNIPLLVLEKPVPYDFLIDSKFLRTSIGKYLEENGLSTENLLDVEYVDSVLPPTPAASFVHDDWISGIAVHRESSLILTGTYDGLARLWTRSGDVALSFQGVHESAVKDVALIAEDEHRGTCFTASMDQNAIEWTFDTKTKSVEPILRFEGHQGSVESLSLNVDENMLATASCDGTVKVWSISTEDVDDVEVQTDNKKRRKVEKTIPNAKQLLSFDAHSGGALSVDFSATHMYSGGSDHAVRCWDISTASNISTMNSEQTVLCVKASRTNANALIASGHVDNAIRVWDQRGEGGSLKLRLDGHSKWVSSVSWSPTNPYMLVSGSYDSTVRMWDIRSTIPFYSMKTGTSEGDMPPPKVLSVLWADFGFLSGGDDCKLRISEPKNPQ